MPIKTACKYRLLPLSELSFSEADPNLRENFTSTENSDFKGIRLPRPKELSLEDESLIEKNIVWIFAFPRSGTQWLGTQLLEHSNIISNGPSIGLELGAVHYRFADKVVRFIDYRGNEPDHFLSNLYKDTWQYYIRKLIVNRLYAQFRDLSKKIIIPLKP